MDNAHRQSFTPVSRSGRILRKSTKQIEAEESLLGELYLMQFSRRKPGSFEDTVHCFGVTNSSLSKGTKVFDIKLRPGSTHSISLSLSDEDVTTQSFQDTINSFKVMNNGLDEESKVFDAKRHPCSIHSTSLSSADADKTPFKSTFQHLNRMNNSLIEENIFSEHRSGSTHSTSLISNNAGETSIFDPLDVMNNSLNGESKRFYSKHHPGLTHSTYLSSTDSDESFNKTFQYLNLVNNRLKEENKILCSKRRPISTSSTSLSSTDDDGTLETGPKNSRQLSSTSSSSEYLQDEEEEVQRDEGIADHKYCTRFPRTRNPINVTIRKPQVNTFENRTFARTKTMNAYTLWSNLHRSIISATNMHLHRRDISKKVIAEWNALPPGEKKFWARKAKELSQRILNQSFSSDSDVGAKLVPSLIDGDSDCNAEFEQSMQIKEHFLSCAPSKKNMRKKKCEEHILSYAPPPKKNNSVKHVLGIAPVDTAAHLTLLGNCLMSIGQKISQADIEPSAAGSYNVLLDSLLCSMGALLCLTREIPGLEQLPGASFTKMLDHIAYFMPGF